MTHDEVGAAIGRLVDLARGDTGGSRIAASFLLAWWNGDDWGHFKIADLWGLDAGNAADVTGIMAYLGSRDAIYADAWGYRDAMGELVERWRPETGLAVAA